MKFRPFHNEACTVDVMQNVEDGIVEDLPRIQIDRHPAMGQEECQSRQNQFIPVPPLVSRPGQRLAMQDFISDWLFCTKVDNGFDLALALGAATENRFCHG
ncbi:MAG: hypothetical protein ACYDHY_18130 [Acidiferrobacterales bacterium]